MEAFRLAEEADGGAGPATWPRLIVDHLAAARAVRRRARARPNGEGTMRTLIDDLVAALRSLARAPRFAIFAVWTLGLGVAAVTAVFTVVERVVVRPLPYPGSERMALVGIDARLDPGSLGPLSPALFAGLRAEPGPAESIVAARTVEMVLTDDDGPERVEVTEISDDFFTVFGARPAVGRLPSASDHAPGSAPTVVLGHATWRDRFGSDPNVPGRSVRLDDRLHTVIGVVGADFVAPPELVEAGGFWIPLEVDPTVTGSFSLAGLARLGPAATLATMDAHVDAVVQRLYSETDRPGFLLGGTVRAYHESVIGHVARNLKGVLAAVSLLLFIACVNVAGLLLTRGASRHHELGVHFALGAPRARIVRKLLGESALLAAVGAALGTGLAWAAVEVFRSTAPAGLPRLAEVALDGRGLAFALALAGGTTLLFGVLPALRSTRTLAPGFRSTRATGGRADGRLRVGLVVVETALAVILATGSGLLAHDLARVTAEDPGFRPDGLVAMTVNLAPRYARAERATTWERILEHARAAPGATSVAVATQAPWDGSRMASTYRPEGWQAEEPTFATTVAVAGDYVEALGSRLVSGRVLTTEDGEGDPVVMVNRAFVERFWPGESGVGREVASGEEDEAVYRVVGVLDDVRTRPGRDVSPHVFHPLAEAPWREMEVLVRTDGSTDGVVAGLREAVHRVDPALPVTSVHTMDVLSSQALAGPRFYAGLFSGFALVALVLALVGVYGTTAYATRARLREAGIRLVLGARGGQVVRDLVARSALALVLGVAVGLTGAALGSRLLAGVLLHVGPRDWLTYLVVGSVVIAAGVTAAWIPASQAGRADPIGTLRQE